MTVTALNNIYARTTPCVENPMSCKRSNKSASGILVNWIKVKSAIVRFKGRDNGCRSTRTTLRISFVGLTKVSRTKRVKIAEIMAGISAQAATARTSPLRRANPINAKPGPITAPILSPVR